MATDKKFAVAGVSTHEGKTKVRFANDTMRVKILGLVGSLLRSLITGSESDYSATASVFATVAVLTLAAVARGFFLTT